MAISVKHNFAQRQKKKKVKVHSCGVIKSQRNIGGKGGLKDGLSLNPLDLAACFYAAPNIRTKRIDEFLLGEAFFFFPRTDTNINNPPQKK